MKKIAIIFGGESVEADISIITALQVLKFAKRGYDVLPIFIDKNGRFLTAKNMEKVSIYRDFNKFARSIKEVSFRFGDGIYIKNKKLKIDAIINCCHGHGGEDGSLAGALELLKIPYTSSSVLSAAATMDKSLTKIILKSKNILTPDFKVVYRNFEKQSISCDFDKVIVKPARLGSSVGIGVAKTKEELLEKIDTALYYDDKVILEEFLEGARELNCAAFKYEDEVYTSKVIEVNKGEIFSFEEKYIKESKNLKQKLDKKLIEKVKELTKKCYEALECFGVVRVDFLLKDDKLYVNEINSVPGALSLYMFDNFDEVLDLLILEAKTREKNKDRIKFSFKSDALKVFEQEEGFYKGKK